VRRYPVIGPGARDSWRDSAESEDPPRKLVHPSEVLRQRPLSARVDRRGDHGAGASSAAIRSCVAPFRVRRTHPCVSVGRLLGRVETLCAGSHQT
jgi:hypothetical protein